MRNAFPIALAVASLFGASIVQAQEVAPHAVLPQINVQGQPPYKLAPHEGDEYVGSFAIETGATLKVWQEQNRLYTKLDAQPAHLLTALAPHSFTTDNGATLDILDEGRTVIVTQPQLLGWSASAQLVGAR